MEAIQYQTHPKLALELATKLGLNAVPSLITALSNPKGDVQRANAYALSKLGKSSPAAVDALKTAVKRERGRWTPRAFRQHLKQIQKG